MSGYRERVMNRLPDRPKTGIRAKASGLVGRNKDTKSSSANTVARPLSQLRDPSSFAAPPKRTGTGPSSGPPPLATSRSAPGAPQRGHSDYATDEPREQPLLEDAERKPSQPYRTDTTGLRTDHLPLPPRRRDGADSRDVAPNENAGVTTRKSPAPRLPPRLPSREGASSSSAEHANGSLNEAAVGRLSTAGISVPGFGIGSSNSSTSASRPPPAPPRTNIPGSNTQVNELQNRFAGLGTSLKPSNNAANTGTTWAEKQATLKTASSFNKDPSSVSFSDAKAAASTANNFRQRHGEQVAAGIQSANAVNQNYGVMNKAGGFAHKLDQQGQTSQGSRHGTAPSASVVAGKKKPPPPPPLKKKPALLTTANAAPDDVFDDEPPPVPLATRPVF